MDTEAKVIQMQGIPEGARTSKTSSAVKTSR
jgi:hypothetical protein